MLTQITNTDAICAQHVFVCCRLLRRPSGKWPHVPPALITHWELGLTRTWLVGSLALSLSLSLSLAYSIRGRRCGGAELGSRISSLCCSCRPGFVSNFMSVDVTDRGHMCSLALKMSHVAKMSSATIPISLAVFQRAQRGLGMTACRHATLPNGSSCMLVPFPLFERAFPDGTNPPSTFPSDRNVPSPRWIRAQVLAINLYKQMTTGSF